MATDGESGTEWEQNRIMQHVMALTGLPKWSDQSEQEIDPRFDGIDPAYRERARYLARFRPILNLLGVSPAELKLTHEPVHPLSKAQLKGVVAERLKAMGAVQYPDGHGLSVVSRSLLDILLPGADLFDTAGVPPNLPDLLLFDPLLGIVMWEENGRERNCWLGGIPETAAVLQMNPQLVRALFPRSQDIFRIGAKVFSFARLATPRTWQQIKPDESLIPSITVTSQAELDALVSDLHQACAQLPMPVKLVFRGQTKEYRVPDRTALVRAGVCTFSDLRDHSLVPSLYRHYDKHLDDPDSFRAFMARLLEWGYYSDMVFGEPAQYFTLDGEPYVPKPVPANARVLAAMGFAGASADNPMFEDLGPTTKCTVFDAANNVIDEYLKAHRPGRDAARRGLVLQHYGAPTPFLDVTHDAHVAEWFALNSLQIGAEGITDISPVENISGDPVIFALLLPAGMASFADTAELVDSGQSLRPHRQACAVVGGVGNLYRNAANRFIGLKIKFAAGFKAEGLPTAEFLFPGPEEDPTLKKLLASYRPSAEPTTSFPVYWLARR